jgi:hypothetical protein
MLKKQYVLVLSDGRSGTHLLMDKLSSSPKIKSGDELVGSNWGGNDLEGDEYLNFIKNNVISYYESLKPPIIVTSIIFSKLINKNITLHDIISLFPDESKIIISTREDQINRFTSLQLARKTKNYTNSINYNNEKVELDISDLYVETLKQFISLKEFCKFVLENGRDAKICEYGDINDIEELNFYLKWIGVKKPVSEKDVNNNYQKQERRDIKDRISNYDQLKKYNLFNKINNLFNKIKKWRN